MSQPLVSIVTPSYNQANYLEQTIRSVLEQEYASIEYIVVDGASTDGSLETIQKYADRLAWWVSERDAGQAEAINKGLRRANGEIVAWLNSDDLYLPGAIAQAATALQRHPEASFVFGDAITIDPSGRQLNHLAFGDWDLNELMRFRIICQPAVFMRRALLEKAGYLDQGYHYMLDHHLWLRLARQAPPLHVGQTWAAARHHPQAKNIAQAAAFAGETARILSWMQSQPDLQACLQTDHRRIQGGAARLRARYLLDGGQPALALREYGRALLYSPRFALQHWHRMLYALLSLAGGQKLGQLYYRWKHGR